MTVLDRTSTIADIVLDHPACARVFRDRRIDFCCKGNLTVDEACAARGIDPAALVVELEQAARDRALRNVDLRALSTAELVRHVVGHHHHYLRETLPFAEQLARKVARVHGERDPKLRDLADTVVELKEELEGHLDEEEETLFPAMLSAATDAGSVASELTTMHDDHLRVGELLARMREQAGDYRVPEGACNSHRTLLRELEAIEADTLSHVHTENHVLMPRFERAS